MDYQKRYREWLENDYFDADTKAELKMCIRDSRLPCQGWQDKSVKNLQKVGCRGERSKAFL